jgi:hypothetical protein
MLCNVGCLMIMCQLHRIKFRWGLKTDDTRITKDTEPKVFTILENKVVVTMLRIVG